MNWNTEYECGRCGAVSTGKSCACGNSDPDEFVQLDNDEPESDED